VRVVASLPCYGPKNVNMQRFFRAARSPCSM